MTDCGSITVIRPPYGARDILRAYRIEIDGSKVGKLRSDREITVPVSAGRHVVRGTIDYLFASPDLEVTVAADQNVRVEVRPAGEIEDVFRLFRRGPYLHIGFETAPTPP